MPNDFWVGFDHSKQARKGTLQFMEFNPRSKWKIPFVLKTFKKIGVLSSVVGQNVRGEQAKKCFSQALW